MMMVSTGTAAADEPLPKGSLSGTILVRTESQSKAHVFGRDRGALKRQFCSLKRFPTRQGDSGRLRSNRFIAVISSFLWRSDRRRIGIAAVTTFTPTYPPRTSNSSPSNPIRPCSFIWMDQDQMDLELPADLIRETGRLSLRLHALSNEQVGQRSTCSSSLSCVALFRGRL